MFIRYPWPCGSLGVMSSHRQQVLSSDLWVAYFRRNARSVTSDDFKPPATRNLPEPVRRVIAASLPAWQLGETSDGGHLRAAARQYALARNDPKFLEAVEMFIREEQRHGAALGDWLDRVGIPRKSRDLGDSLFRLCRHAIPSYAVWATVVVMVEAMAELYYASLRCITPCVRLKSECDRILRDEVRHIEFQCEHLAVVRRGLPRLVRMGLDGVVLAFYAIVCTAVFVAHGRVMSLAGLPLPKFIAAAAGKFRYLRALMDPDRYVFSDAVTVPPAREEESGSLSREMEPFSVPPAPSVGKSAE